MLTLNFNFLQNNVNSSVKGIENIKINANIIIKNLKYKF